MTRRLVETRALGSTTGAGIGAAFMEVTGAAGSQPQAGSSQPQAGSPASSPASHESQLLSLQDENSFARRPPHLGPEAASHASSHPSAAGSQPQAGSSSPASSQLLSQPSSIGNNLESSPPQLFAAGESHPGSQPSAAGSHPQTGSSQPHAGSSEAAGASQPQAGSSQPQAGSASLPASAASQATVSQLEPHLIPSIRSKRSKPNDGLLIPQPITKAIVKIVRFIGATSPFRNLAGLFVLLLAENVRMTTRTIPEMTSRGAVGGRSRRRAHLFAFHSTLIQPLERFGSTSFS